MFNTVLTKLAKVIALVGCLWAVGCSTDVRRYDDVLTLWRKGDVVADADGILQLPKSTKRLAVTVMRM